MSGNLCCFFCVGLSAFSSPKLRFRSRWTQTVKVEARPHHSRDSPQLVIISPTNKQTNKQRESLSVSVKKKNGCEQKRRESSEKVAWQQVQSIRGPILSKFISSRCPLTVNTSTSQERPPSFLPSFLHATASPKP